MSKVEGFGKNKGLRLAVDNQKLAYKFKKCTSKWVQARKYRETRNVSIWKNLQSELKVVGGASLQV